MTAKLDFNENKKILYGSTMLTSTNTEEEVGGYVGFDKNNRFNLYQQLYTVTPHAFMAFQKLGLTLVKNFRFEGKKNLIKNFEKWSEDINFGDRLQTMARLALMNGTYVALYTNINTTTDSDDITPDTLSFEPLLMSSVTLLSDKVIPGNVDLSKKMLPPVTKVYVDENKQGFSNNYRADDCFIFSYCPRDKVQKDILGRETYGIYGVSLFDSVEDLIYKYLDLVNGYTNYIKKYGIGRYAINYRLLEDLVKDGTMTIDDALTIMQQLADTNATIKQNQDIVSIGMDLKNIDNGGSNINVTDMKNSLENDIALGLLQSSVANGNGAGLNYSSAYIAEDDRLLALEGIQQALQSALNAPDGIIGKRLSLMGKKPGDVKIVFEELSKPQVTADNLYQAMMVDAVTIGEYRSKALNLPAQKPEDELNKDLELDKGEKNSNESEDTPDETNDMNPPDNYPEYPSDNK